MSRTTLKRELERVDEAFQRHQEEGTWLGGFVPMVQAEQEPEPVVEEPEFYVWGEGWPSEND
jgi:hypothetical protein